LTENPYAPPVETTPPRRKGGAAPVAPVAAGERVPFSAEALDLVTSLAKWMRVVAAFEVVLAGLLVLALLGLGLGTFTDGSSGGRRSTGILLLVAGAIALLAFLLFLAAAWLRRAAAGFVEGLLGEEGSFAAEGFGRMRGYQLLYGLFNLVGLGLAILARVLDR
jgi:hypothetical protein